MQGKPFELTLPENLAPGGYLLRHEIIALQLATSAGGAEFYPSCTQLLIGGSGNGTPASTVSFPGAYSDTDPGILDPDVYNPGSKYTFPGPPVSNLASGGASSGNSTAPAAPSADPAAPALSSSSAQVAPTATGSSGKTCKSGAKKRMVKRHAKKHFMH